MIELFAHNRIAYESAVKMLSEAGKAAVIHPTGTGKSFIGFKLCEDNPKENIVWLSPSEYIFTTQLENLQDACGYIPQNIIFLTYAKLMLMTDDEISALDCGYIVLDEFHRCGAKMWGEGVRRLLLSHANVPVLGLSATNIRYLDNQRDMADELFEGNIASEMTLGEAIARGILSAPKYVVSLYSYQNELDKYAARLEKAKGRPCFSAAQRYFEALKRTLEKAEGIEKVFAKHMSDKTGKYIVFCSDYENMQSCISKAGEWFASVDPNPHIYSVYSSDPSSDESFKAFKNDNSQAHLRLLFCIDALNEGVHVGCISGVILFRPTTSPIIYKQQIGRTLSAGYASAESSGIDRAPIIFDIVNNFENLYSVGAVEEEMRSAVVYYRDLGDPDEIVTDSFEIIDEARDVRSLFERLEDTLSASWEQMFQKAREYYAQHGCLDVERRYKTPDGYSLGSWLCTQRKIREGEQFGSLSKERIAKLDSIGMRWQSVADISWEKYFTAAQKYYDSNGNLDIKTQYVTPDGIRLGSWLAGIRTCRKNGLRSSYLTEERAKQLDGIGMIWSQPDYVWERNYSAALDYYRQHGDLEVPADCVVNGVRLGRWIVNLRTAASGRGGYAMPTEAQKQRLDELGMRWTDKASRQWEIGYSHAEEFYKSAGNLDVASSYKTESGYSLGAWISKNRTAYKNGKLSDERIDRLNSIGMIWDKSNKNSWSECYDYAKAYYQEHGNLNVPANYKANGIWLNKWLNEQKQIYLGKRPGKSLSREQVRWLEDIGAGILNDNKPVSRRRSSVMESSIQIIGQSSGR